MLEPLAVGEMHARMRVQAYVGREFGLERHWLAHLPFGSRGDAYRLVHANRRVRSPRWCRVQLGTPLASTTAASEQRVASGGFQVGKRLAHAKRRVRSPRWCRVRLRPPLACTTAAAEQRFA